jgi:hypothetical protein
MTRDVPGLDGGENGRIVGATQQVGSALGALCPKEVANRHAQEGCVGLVATAASTRLMSGTNSDRRGDTVAGAETHAKRVLMDAPQSRFEILTARNLQYGNQKCSVREPCPPREDADSHVRTYSFLATIRASQAMRALFASSPAQPGKLSKHLHIGWLGPLQ